MRLAFVLGLLVTSATTAAAQQSEAAESRCGPAPRLILDNRSDLAPELFGEGTAAHRAITASFVAGISRACDEGGIGGVFRDGGGVVRLRNDPGRRTAQIHSVSVRGARGLDGVVLRYRFLADNRAVRLPTAEEIKDAIYCRRTSAHSSQREPDRCPED